MCCVLCVCVCVCDVTCHLCVGLDVREVAHDYATAVNDYVTRDLKLLNFYDTWHGMLTLFRDSLCMFQTANFLTKVLRMWPRQ